MPCGSKKNIYAIEAEMLLVTHSTNRDVLAVSKALSPESSPGLTLLFATMVVDSADI